MSKVYNILMIATGHDQGMLQKLIGSIQPDSLVVYLIIVNQGPEFDFKGNSNTDVLTLNVGKPLALSAARNRALRFAHQKGIGAHHVMFPDDDSTFDAQFFKSYKTLVETGKAYLGRVCAEEDGQDYKSYPRENILKGETVLLPYVASVALIIPQEVIKKVGYFDENLGAGAKWASSEDVDYFIRCTAYGPFTFLRELRNFHPSRFGKYGHLAMSQIKNRFKGYTDGYLYVMFRYDLMGKARSLPWRALAGAVVSLLRGTLRLVPVYLGLARYRFAMLRFFKKKKKENPQFFALP